MESLLLKHKAELFSSDVSAQQNDNPIYNKAQQAVASVPNHRYFDNSSYI